MKHLDQIFYPPVGIVHIIKDIAQLVSPWIGQRKAIHINTSAQPNSHPHLGSVTTLMTAFALGRHLGATFNMPVRLTFDQLENAPGEKRTHGTHEYQKMLSDIYEGQQTLTQKYMDSFRWVFDELSKRTNIPCQICTYAEFQKKKPFRRSLLEILKRYVEFANLLSPAENLIRLRFPCPECRYVDKTARTVKIVEMKEKYAILSSHCFLHGSHQVKLSERSADFIDTNTPLRDVAKGVTLIEEGKANNELMIMCDGADWGGVWNMRVFCDGITRLGYAYQELPLRFFAPIITDWSGAKFSKSLYVKHNAYQCLPEGFLNFSVFINTFGMDGFNQLWKEVADWPCDPKKMFRNYSIDYLKLVLNI